MEGDERANVLTYKTLKYLYLRINKQINVVRIHMAKLNRPIN